MDQRPIAGVEDLEHQELVDLFLEMLHRSWMHYGLWFQAAQAQTEADRFPAAERRVFAQTMANVMARLGKVLGFAVDARGVPQRVKDMSQPELCQAVRALAVNWYVGDGIWFQELEGLYDMDLAKRANDSVWARYAPYEARHIALFLGLPPQCGLQGLRAALPLRSAALINTYAYQWSQDGSLVLKIVECRIQTARRRKGLPPYPCRSAGMVEHVFFARALDARIVTQCLGCPPDEQGQDWCCAWRFSLEQDQA
ncbi:MAG: cytosolic protein [Desulfarculus sp.]|nr:cytosolic protein [Desulfarculus sp.]